jgi:hypothetical protein
MGRACVFFGHARMSSRTVSRIVGRQVSQGSSEVLSSDSDGDTPSQGFEEVCGACAAKSSVVKKMQWFRR